MAHNSKLIVKSLSPWRRALPALLIGPVTYLVTVAVIYLTERFR